MKVKEDEKLKKEVHYCMTKAIDNCFLIQVILETFIRNVTTLDKLDAEISSIKR